MQPTPEPSVAGRRGVVVALLAMWLGLVVLTWWEPVLGDGWDYEIWIERHGGSPGSFLEFARWSFLEDNPRLGQILGFFTFVDPLHVVLTPLVVLGLVIAIFVLAAGRLPGRAGDGARLISVAAVILVVTPQVGVALLYRPYTVNYIYALVLQLAWAIPFRLALGGDVRGQGAGIAAAVGMFVLGALAGMGNEHTGLAWLGFGAVAVARAPRRRPWMVTGVAGLLAGYMALILAPGQGRRYAGLAGEYSPIDALFARGLGGNLISIAAPALAVASLAAIALLALAAARGAPAGHDRPLSARWWLVPALAMSAFGLIGPKIGARLHIAPTLLATIAVVPLVWRALAHPRRGALVRGLAIAVVAGHALWLGHVYRRAHRECAERRQVLASTPPGGTAVVAPLTMLNPSRWFRGDDFRSADIRRRVARRRFGLHDAALRGQPATPWDYQLDVSPPEAAPPAAPDFPVDIAKARQLFADLTRGGARPPERAVLVVVGWSLPEQRGRPLIVDHTGPGLTRPPRARLGWDGLDREVRLSDGAEVTEVWIAVPDEPARRSERRGPGRFHFPVWRTSLYAVVACTADTCFLVMSVYQEA